MLSASACGPEYCRTGGGGSDAPGTEVGTAIEGLVPNNQLNDIFSPAWVERSPPFLA